MVLSLRHIKKSKNRIALIIFVFISLVFFLFLKYRGIQPVVKCIDCNIILISVDSLRPDHLSSYGYLRNTSANIDRFAEDAIIFKKAFSQSYWTLPSHASIFTSRYPSAHGVTNMSQKLDDSEVVLAEILKNNGYKTLAFTGNGFVSSVFGFSQGFDIFVEDDFFLASNIRNALKWIELNKGVKFFIFLHGYEVHSIPMIPKQFVTMYTDPGYNGIAKTFYLDWAGDLSKIYNYTYNSSGTLVQLNRNDIDYIIACYDGGVYYVDYIIGILLDNLKKFGLDKNTIIIITSDHGVDLMEHGYIGWKYDIYDNMIHVPLIIKNPKMPFKNKVIENQVQSIDIMPTILDFVNISIPSEVQGRSLLPLILGQENTSLPVYSEKEDSISIRTNKFKFIWRYSGKHELYNLTSDPEEQINLIDKHPNLGRVLEEEINRFLEMSKKKTLNATKISEEEFKKIESKLKELGYV